MNQKQCIVQVLDRSLLAAGVDTRGLDMYRVAQDILGALDNLQETVVWPGFFEPQLQKRSVWDRIRHKVQTFNVWIGKPNKEGIKV